MNSFTPLAVLAALLLGGASARAQSPAPQPSPSPSPESEAPLVTHSERVVVAASRVEQHVADAPSGVLLRTQADLDRSPALTVADELRSVPGFTQRPSSSLLGRVQNQFAAFRGLQGGSSRALVLFDGVPLVDGFAGWPYWSRVPAEGVERVEVARGGGASAWGNLAMTGVVNIVTLAPEARHVRLSAEAGGHGTLRTAGYLSERLGRLGVALAGDYHETDGYSDVQPTSAARSTPR
jgi:outer membrane cobalamin receptor